MLSLNGLIVGIIPECEDASSEVYSYNDTNSKIFQLLYNWCITRFKVQRSYESPYRTYYIVVTPFAKQRGVALGAIYKKYSKDGCERILVTREKLTSDGRPINPHYNVLVTTKKVFHSGNFNYFNLNVQQVVDLTTLPNVIYYMLKEAKLRTYERETDFKIFCKSSI